jgi:hypothetical protein
VTLPGTPSRANVVPDPSLRSRGDDVEDEVDHLTPDEDDVDCESDTWNVERHRRQGRDEGFPDCCIEAFCADIAAHRSPFHLRGGTNGYVPCESCKARGHQ